MADKRLEEISGSLETMKIGLDGTFTFHCTMCGKCCINREDILLSPKDIFNMAKALGLSTMKLLEKYCEAYIGPDSRIPIVRLLPKGAAKRCPLLKNQKCLVHKAKPTVCAMFPIGRCLIAQNQKEGLTSVSEDMVQYIFIDPECGDQSETHTVRSYLESFGIQTPDRYFIRWQQTVLDMCRILPKIEKIRKPEEIEMVWTAVLTGLYLHYDTSADFMPQFESNIEKFFRIVGTAFPECTKREP